MLSPARVRRTISLTGPWKTGALHHNNRISYAYGIKSPKKPKRPKPTNPANMSDQHPNYLLLLHTQVPDALFDYAPLHAWLNERYRRIVASAGPTAHAVLLHTREAQEQIEPLIRTLLGPPDNMRLIRIRDFEWPSALPDDETLMQWLEDRADWQEWSEGH